MAGYIVFGSLTAWNIVMTIRERHKASELYAHLSLSIFFGILLFSFLHFSSEIFIIIFQKSPIGEVTAVRIAGLSIVLAGFILYLFALTILKSRGALEKNRHLETGRLVTSGIYRHVRHPMVLAVFMLCFGLMVWRLSIAVIIAYVVIVLFYLMAQHREEESLIARFGGEYQRYRQRVPALNIIRGLIRSKKR